MKKLAPIIAVFCALLLITACAAELPDPVPEVEKFYKESIKNIESDAAKNMMNNSAFHDLVEGIPELEEPLKNFVAAYLEDITYRIEEDETIIDKKEKTAEVLVEVSCVDMNKLHEHVMTLVTEKSNEIMATGRAATQEELNEFYLTTIVQLIADGDTARVSGYQVVELSYNDSTAKWEVTNGDALVSELTVETAS